MLRVTALLLLLIAAPALAQDAPPSTSAPAFDDQTDTGAVEQLPIISGPDVTHFVEAQYPPEALAQGLEATVVLLVQLDDKGQLVDVQVDKPAGHGFDEAALAAVKQMTFSPAMTAEGPVPVVFELPYGFTLNAPPPDETQPPAPPPVNLDGEVVQMPTRNPIEGARVVVEGTDLVATTDDKGHFELRGVPVGAETVKVLDPDYVSVTAKIEIPEGQVVTWRFWMRPERYRENEAVAVYHTDKEEVTRRTISIGEVRRVPGTFGDPIKVVQTLPGAARTPFGTGLLVIRGANPEDSGVYVDGVRIPIIYHLTGTTSVLSPDLIAAVDYLPGGYGVQYGRSMGGVVDVHTKDTFKDRKLVWHTDVLDSGVYFEGNLGKHKKQGIAIAARRSYIDAFIPLFAPSDFTLKPVYWDYQAKWVPTLKGDQKLSVFVYGFRDILRVGTPPDVNQGSDPSTQGDLKTMYSSQRLAVNYQRKLGEGLTLYVTPSFGVDFNDFDLGGQLRLKSFNGIGELRAELDWELSPAVTLVPGIDFLGGFYNFGFDSPFSFDSASDPLAERQPVAVTGRGTAWAPDAYVKALLRPLKDRDRLLITPGIRVSSVYYTFGGSLFDLQAQAPSWAQAGFDPRIATRFALFEKFTLKASTGLYTQPPQPYQSFGFGTDVKLEFERSWSSSLGFEHQITPSIQWSLEGFYRKMDDLVVFNPAFQAYGDVNWLNSGQGRAYGLEVILRQAPVNHFFGWISYTLSRSERKDAPTDNWYLFDFDQTHILSAQAGYELPWGLDASGQVQYVTGNPTSLYNAGVYDVDSNSYNPFRIGPYNGDRLPPYFQVSVRVDKLWTFKVWQLDTYFELLNVVRGVNPEFTQYAYDYSQHAFVRGLPFIPNIGIEARFFP